MKDKDDRAEEAEVENKNEFPKALNELVDGRLVPVKWPADHPKGGTDVVFENAEEERAYKGKRK